MPITPVITERQAAAGPASRRAAGKAGDGGAVPRVAWHFALAEPEGGSPARALLASGGLRETTDQRENRGRECRVLEHDGWGQAGGDEL